MGWAGGPRQAIVFTGLFHGSVEIASEAMQPMRRGGGGDAGGETVGLAEVLRRSREQAVWAVTVAVARELLDGGILLALAHQVLCQPGLCLEVEARHIEQPVPVERAPLVDRQRAVVVRTIAVERVEGRGFHDRERHCVGFDDALAALQDRFFLGVLSVTFLQVFEPMIVQKMQGEGLRKRGTRKGGAACCRSVALFRNAASSTHVFGAATRHTCTGRAWQAQPCALCADAPRPTFSFFAFRSSSGQCQQPRRCPAAVSGNQSYFF